MKAIYAGTARKAASDQTQVFAKASGMSEAETEKLQTKVTSKLAALSEPLHLDPHELRDLNTIVLAHFMDIAHGKPVAEKVDRWVEEAKADLRSRHVSNDRVNQVIRDTNEWLKTDHPEVHRALKNTEGLGSHPQIVRKLTDRFLAREAENARAKRGAKPKAKSTGNSGAAVPEGGLMAGNDPSGTIGATALQALSKSPLGAPDA